MAQRRARERAPRRGRTDINARSIGIELVNPGHEFGYRPFPEAQMAALIELARAFPKSEFHGYDISRHALARAADNKKEAGTDNVHFHDPLEEPMPTDGRFGSA